MNIRDMRNIDLHAADEEQMNELLLHAKTFSPELEEPKGFIIGVYVRWENDLVMLPKPRRHAHCIWCGYRAYGRWRGDGHIDQGFFTENFVLLDRYEARKYVTEIGQFFGHDVKRKAHLDNIIYSEDLW